MRLREPLLIALALRLAAFLLGAGDPSRYMTLDARAYLAAAQSFQATYVSPQGAGLDLGLFIAPGYPTFIALVRMTCGLSLHVLILLQVALGVATVAVVGYIAGALHGAPAGRRAAYLLAVDPCSVLYVCFVQPEALFGWLVMLAVLALSMSETSSWAAPLAGLLLGLAALTRAAGLYLPIALAAGWYLASPAKRRARRVAGMLLVFALPASAWIARN